LEEERGEEKTKTKRRTSKGFCVPYVSQQQQNNEGESEEKRNVFFPFRKEKKNLPIRHKKEKDRQKTRQSRQT